jgi:hypothetical protein
MPGGSLHRRAHQQRGAAFLLSVFILAIVGVSAFVATTRGSEGQIDRERITAAALAEAKAALIGYAAGVALTGPERPGDMPCPDRDNDGDADPPCASEATSLGRLPWRTLGLPDLRDGSGERLWYAVSAAFRNNPRSNCAAPAAATCLNSDSRGTLTVRLRDDTVLADGANPDPFVPSGAIAVIIAPGALLTRQGAAQPQVRACDVGKECNSSGRCLLTPPTDTPTCNPVNYLDVATAGSAEDNADFIEASANGFIMGPVRVGADEIVNDRIAMVTYRDLMPLLERRVVREVRNCLDQYASTSNDRYPWAADTTLSATSNDFRDVTSLRAGRLPDTMDNTNTSSGTAMNDSWPVGCPIAVGNWWTNWKLHVFYAVADSFKPDSTAPVSPCLGCLTIDTVNGLVPDARYFVTTAGLRLRNVNGGQPRDTAGDRSNPANYLEGENSFALPLDTPDWFRTRASTTPTDHFNDATLFR